MSQETVKIKNLITVVGDTLFFIFNKKSITEKSYRLKMLLQSNQVQETERFLSQMSARLVQKILSETQSNSFVSRNKPNGDLAILDSVRSVEAFHLLCQYGLDLSVLNDNGENALWGMVKQGQPQIFKVLLARGVNPNIMSIKNNEGEKRSLFVFMVEQSINQPTLLKHLQKNMQALIECGGQVSDFYTKDPEELLNTNPVENLIKAHKYANPENVAHVFDCIKYIVEQVVPTLRHSDISKSSKDLIYGALSEIFILAHSPEIFSYFLNKITGTGDDIEKLESLYQMGLEHSSSKERKQMTDYVGNKIQEIKSIKERVLIEDMLDNTQNAEITPQRSQAKRQKI